MGTNFSSSMEILILITRCQQGCYLSYSCMQHFSIHFVIYPNPVYKLSQDKEVERQDGEGAARELQARFVDYGYYVPVSEDFKETENE